MEVLLAITGILLVTTGSSLLYMFSDPHFGDGLMLTTHNARKEMWGARAGLALNLVGAVAQLAAVLIAVG